MGRITDADLVTLLDREAEALTQDNYHTAAILVRLAAERLREKMANAK